MIDIVKRDTFPNIIIGKIIIIISVAIVQTKYFTNYIIYNLFHNMN